jgi:hypothetical protein
MQEENTTTGEQQDSLVSGLKVWAKVGVELGQSVEKLTKAQNTWAKMQYNTPVDYQVFSSGTYSSTNGLYLPLGQPDVGTYWEVHTVVVGGTDFGVTALGQAGLYVSGYPGVSALNLARDYASSLPNTATYGTRVLIVNDSETLWLKIFNGTTGQQYVANACVTVYKNNTAFNVVVDS